MGPWGPNYALAWGGKNLLRWVSMKAEAAGWERSLQCWSFPLCVTEQWHLTSMVAWLSSAKYPVVELPIPFLLECLLKATDVPSLSSVSKVHFSTPRPSLYQETHNSGWDAQERSTDRVHRSYSILPSTDWLLHSPPKSLSFSVDSPSVRGLLWVWEPFLSFTSAPSLQGSCSFPIDFFLSFILTSCVGFFLSF